MLYRPGEMDKIKLPGSSIIGNSRQIFVLLQIMATHSAYAGHWGYKHDVLSGTQWMLPGM